MTGRATPADRDSAVDRDSAERAAADPPGPAPDRPPSPDRPRWVRYRLTEPLLWPTITTAVAMAAAVIGSFPLCWAALAALAGYSLSGSV